MATIQRDTTFKKNSYEYAAWAKKLLVCGVDEVGRGCLAGPVVAGAVILYPGKKSHLIKDSKLLSPKQRLIAYQWIKKNSWNAIGIVHHRTIDRINIYQATMMAMKRALTQLFVQLADIPHYILVDAVPLLIATYPYDIVAFPFGESKSISIAAASIIAKVSRDNLIKSIDPLFPGYALSNHKGYSTPQHKQCIREFSAAIIHRKSFIDHFDYLYNSEQLNFFDSVTTESTP